MDGGQQWIFAMTRSRKRRRDEMIVNPDLGKTHKEVWTRTEAWRNALRSAISPIFPHIVLLDFTDGETLQIGVMHPSHRANKWVTRNV
jgi:hypothetical protein